MISPNTGTPLHLRHIRVPFSAYLKPQQLTWCLGEQGVRQLLPIFEIPTNGMSTEEAVRVRSDPDAVVDLAKETSVCIPDESEASLSLIREYEDSQLGEFHKKFYSHEKNCASQVHTFCPEILPPCTRWIVDHPNDWLLKPGGVQHVTRTLMALGWNPVEVASLIGTLYQGDFDWKDRWLHYDAAYRAMFYVRLFAGLIVTRQDRLIDFNCVSHKEKGYCPLHDCNWNLTRYQKALMERRENGELDDRLVHGLLLAGNDI